MTDDICGDETLSLGEMMERVDALCREKKVGYVFFFLSKEQFYAWNISSPDNLKQRFSGDFLSLELAYEAVMEHLNKI